MFLGSSVKDIEYKGGSFIIATQSLFAKLLESFTSPWILLFGDEIAAKYKLGNCGDLQQQIDDYRGFIKAIIDKKVEKFKEKGKSSDQNDLTDNLLQHIADHPNESDSISYVDLVNEFILFFMAGTDTTSHLTQTIIYYLT